MIQALAVEKTPSEMRESILKLENALIQTKEIQVKIKTTHYFAPGIYMREIFIPKGVCLTGAFHKTEHQSVLSLGEVTVVNEKESLRLKAPAVVKSMPGIKRAMLAHEDSIWTTIHPNPDNLRDLAAIEERLVCTSYEEVQPFIKDGVEPEPPLVTYQCTVDNTEVKKLCHS